MRTLLVRAGIIMSLVFLIGCSVKKDVYVIPEPGGEQGDSLQPAVVAE